MHGPEVLNERDTRRTLAVRDHRHKAPGSTRSAMSARARTSLICPDVAAEVAPGVLVANGEDIVHVWDMGISSCRSGTLNMTTTAPSGPSLALAVLTCTRESWPSR